LEIGDEAFPSSLNLSLCVFLSVGWSRNWRGLLLLLSVLEGSRQGSRKKKKKKEMKKKKKKKIERSFYTL
jgi:hypothetical protein